MKSEKNYVIVTGKIKSSPYYSHECFGESFYTIDLEVKRDSGVYDELSIFISDRIVCMTYLMPGITITVNGNMRTYNNRDANRKLIVYIFAEEIQFESENFSQNAIDITGYICKKDEVRETPLGRQIIDVIIAVNRLYGKSDYIPCIIWGKNAKYISEQEIGTKVRITGRFQSRKYTKDNIERTAYEVSAQTVDVLPMEHNLVI